MVLGADGFAWEPTTLPLVSTGREGIASVSPSIKILEVAESTEI